MSAPNDLRASLWVRWPDETGPLWACVHINRRRGEAVVVGMEVWTEPPGSARADLGPEADPADDFLPWAPIPLRGVDVRSVSLAELAARLLTRLPLGPPVDGPETAVGASESRARRGRPPRYGPDHWRAVAVVWTRADPSRRRVAVAEAFSVSINTAKHWIARCRQMGLL